MRIIGGEFRGQTIKAPSGVDTRPTTDRVREAMASAIISYMGDELSEMNVLDGFAGSGALGLEMLSRGVAHVTFVERHRPTAQLIEKSISSLKISRQRASVVKGDLFGAVEHKSLPGAPFELILLDPPYDLPAMQLLEVLENLVRNNMIVPGALIVYERACSQTYEPKAPFELYRSKTYGTSCVDYLTFKPEQIRC